MSGDRLRLASGTPISVVLPHWAMEVLGVTVVAFGLVGLAYAVVEFRRTRNAPTVPVRPQWLAGLLLDRIRENATVRDLEEQWFAYMIVWTALGIVVGFAMILHG